jgi:DUF2934 family protein
MADGSRPRRVKRQPSPRNRRDVFPTFEEIAELAYQLFLANGRHVERVFDYWQEAENELLDRAAGRVLR